MKRFPAEFEALLSPAGRRLLKGKHPARDALLRGPFYSSDALLDPKPLPACTKLLAKAFTDLLEPVERELPAPNLSPKSYYDTLPKVGRMHSVPMHGPQQLVALERAKEIGLFEMMYSQSYRAFCEALAGEALEGPQAAQVLCYRPHDYAGPHTDHHPDEPRAKNGYVDVHLTFTTSGVKQQFIVYEHGGHLTEQRSIAENGTVTAYRLPVWHYTTPLLTRSKNDRRWLVLGSFMLKASASDPSASPSASEAPPPSSSAPARQSGDS